MLGQLGLILSSMKMTSTANYGTIAAWETAAISEELRANIPSLASFGNPANPQQDVNCYQNIGCATTTLVNNQVAAWSTRLTQELPGGSGVICQDNSAPITGNAGGWNCSGGAADPFVIKICWDESRLNMTAIPVCVYTRL